VTGPDRFSYYRRRFLDFLQTDFHVEDEPAQNPIHAMVLGAAGIKIFEIEKSEAAESTQGPLDELSASNVKNGPFKILLTKIPSRHLTFDESSQKPTILLLDLAIVRDFVIPQGIGLSRSRTSLTVTEFIDFVVYPHTYLNYFTLTFFSSDGTNARRRLAVPSVST
jgi:hypothetical protein